MRRKTPTVAEQRKYRVVDVQSAKEIASAWLQTIELETTLCFGLPEVDDRYHAWRVPLIHTSSKQRLGEIVIDAHTSLVIESKTTDVPILKARLHKPTGEDRLEGSSHRKTPYQRSPLGNTIALGDSEEILQQLPAASIELVFTSPPYYNARPEYSDFLTYDDYLQKIRNVVRQTHRVLAEGRFFVMNIAPVLLRRTSRSASSRRIAVPFDMHQLFMEEGYEFIDDIIWEKPEGAGWATSRGRRFAADRHPLQYKPVPVTEYILVYRKQSTRLIDWHIHAHPDQDIVAASRIDDDYERTNVWRITPTYDKRHPATFPIELAEKVILYYSFQEDVILDPFAGTGTVAKAAIKHRRKFVLIEKEEAYIDIIRQEIKDTLGTQSKHITTINCPPMDASDVLL